MYIARRATFEEFRESRETWNGLAESMRFPNVFCSWEWIWTWWEHFGRELEPVLVFVGDGAALKGILPLSARRTRFDGGWLTGRILTYAGVNEVYPDQQDVICAASDAGACLQAVQALFATEYRQWDVLQLPLVTEDSALAQWIGAPAFPFEANLVQVSTAPYIAIEGSFDPYIGSLDKKTRYNLRSRRKKLAEQHRIQFLHCEEGDEKQALDRLFALHERRAKKKGMTSTFEGPRIRAFHEALIERLRGTGVISLSVLRNERESIAASYNFIFANRVFSYQKGSDPGWAQFGPGSVMLYECIRDAFAHGCVEYNLLQGDEPYKFDWTSRARPLLNACVFNATVSGRLSRAGCEARQRLKHLVDALRKSDQISG